MKKVPKSIKVVISGYYGFGNFGDEAILLVLVRELKKLLPGINITVLSKTPEVTSKELGVNSVDRMNFVKVIPELMSANMLISGGGSLLQDVTGPLTIYYYLIIILLASILGCKTVIYSQGIGPINRKLSKILTSLILRLPVYKTVRDLKSLEFLKTLNIESELTSDPVWLGLEDNRTKNQQEIGISEYDNYVTIN
ncbi:MAG: polysaccharide pyruvyl transferase family protein, partial [Cyanobacteriota bacterium]